MTTGIRAACAQALSLVLPVDCAGCDAPDEALCAACRGALGPVTPFASRTPGGIEVWSALTFDGPVARVVRTLKEDGRTALARALAPALAAAVARAGRGAAVPVPTSRRALRRRGFRVVDLVARRAGVPFAPTLSFVRTTADQRGLGRERRRRNVAGSMRARPGAGDVVVIDDVVTTGATIDEAARALWAAGFAVVGAATIAATVKRG